MRLRICNPKRYELGICNPQNYFGLQTLTLVLQRITYPLHRKGRKSLIGSLMRIGKLVK